MTTTTTVTGLTRDDLHALRTAGSVSFHMYEGRAYVRAYVDGVQDVYTKREQTVFPRTDIGAPGRGREIGCEGVAYSADGDMWPRDASCFHMVYRGNPAWATVAALLKAGDTLSLDWVADNNNGYSTDAGLHIDNLRLDVHRGDHRFTFLIGYGVTPDNSARMIRR